MTHLAALVALLVAAPQEAATPAEPVSLRLVASPKRGAGDLRFEGKALFPDGIVLKATLFRSEGRFVVGRLVPELAEVGNDSATVEAKRLSFTIPSKDSGLY